MNLGKWYSYFSHDMGALLPLDSHLVVYFIIGEMHGFSSQIFHSIRKVSETHRMGKTWAIGSHTFSIKCVAFSIRFPFCGILHHIGNAWVFSSNFHSKGKFWKTHQMGKVREIGSRENATKPIVWEINPGKLSVGNCFPGKSCKTHRMWRTWEIGNHTCLIVWLNFSH